MRRNILVVALLVIAIGLFAGLVLICRHEQKRRGETAPSAPTSLPVAYGDGLPKTGRFTSNITYTLFGAPGSGEVESSVLWDDAWFTRDPNEYNHELARASAVLSALAYSESGYYQASSEQPPYMEDALAELGFSHVSTESYRYRSEVVDEVLDAVTMRADGVAYTIASKGIASADGSARELIMVSVRGSYGSEWLSNFNMFEGGADKAAAALADEGGYHHAGYEAAAEEILAELARWREAAHDRGREVSILLCGHSRGGAVAGLLAVMLDDGAQAGDSVYAYTFASPRTTVAPEGAPERYGNIFNIVNPADVVPFLPLEGWGYTRYGVDIALPSVEDDDFEAGYAEMRRAFKELTGGESAYLPETETSIAEMAADVSAHVSTAGDLLTPGGVAAVAGALATHIDPLTVLLGHYPSVYIAWLDVLDEGDMLENCGSG